MPPASMPPARLGGDADAARAIEAELGRLGPFTPAGTMRKFRVLERAGLVTAGFGVGPPLEARFRTMELAGLAPEAVDEIAEPDTAPSVLARFRAEHERATPHRWPRHRSSHTRAAAATR